MEKDKSEGSSLWLMHKDIPVCEIEITRYKNRVKQVENYDLLPFPAKKDINLLWEWLDDRAIPETRDGVKGFIPEDLLIGDTYTYMFHNLGLSLTDCYWIKPPWEEHTWKEINFFENDFPVDHNLSKHTPDATLKGDLPKKWVIGDNRERILIKGNHLPSSQQSLNEKFASLVCGKQQAVPYVEYETIPYSFHTFFPETDNEICCFSENFIKDDSMEFICAYDLFQLEKSKGSMSNYSRFVNACEKVELDRKEVKDFLSFQIMLDFLLTNTDRRFNNFGIIRDTETLKPISMAPIYDTGSCLFWNIWNRNRPVFIEGMMDKIRVHSFVKWEDRLLKYVEDKNCLDLSKLPTDQEMYDIFSEGGVLPEERISFIMQCFHTKARMIDRLQEKQAVMKYDATRQEILPLNSLPEDSEGKDSEESEEEERE